MKDKKVRSMCDDCGGTGLYSGMCEGKGRAVICLTCNGTGCYEFHYTPFVARKSRKDIKTVSLSKGRYIFGPIGPKEGSEMSYEDFLSNKWREARR